MLHAIAAFLRREGETLERAPAHEMLRVGLCLAFTGGFLDAYTYLLRGGVFANAQTGNMVLMALYAARRDGRAFYYLLPIAAFLAGVIVTEWLKARLTNAQHIAWQHVVLLAEAILVFAVGFVPRSVPDAVVNVTVSFICSLQVNSFRRTRGLPYANDVHGQFAQCRRACVAWAHGDKRRRAALRYCAVILVFCAGAWAGAVLAGAWAYTPCGRATPRCWRLSG
ncbi:MAG: YoaK family protein [Ruthenibacterium lactatiformans]